ncbi:hypothetical protein Tco_0921154 [Tanacetum coccineum]
MTGGLFRGTLEDNIGATPAGITKNAFGSTSGGPLEINFETPLDGAIPSTREHIKGHLSALRSLLKEHNGRGNVSPIRLSFDDTEDQPRVQTIVTGKVGDADLKKPFKEAVKTPLTRRIIEFAGPEFKIEFGQVAHACVVPYVPTNLGMGAREGGLRTSQMEALMDGQNSGSSSQLDSQ